MQKLQTQLKTISKSLASLSKQVERLSKQASKTQPAKKAATKRKPVAKRAAPAKGKTVLDTVLTVIKRSKKGVSIADLKKKTGFESRQVSNAVYKLTKRGEVTSKSRGVYVKK